MSESPLVGDVVIFYEHGDAGNVPNAAVVTDVSNDYCVNLMVLPNLNANCYAVRACYHLSHEVSRNVRTRFGGWESKEEYRSRVLNARELQENQKKQMEKTAADKEEVYSDSKHHESILKLHMEGKEIRKICEVISQSTGQNWNFNRVRSIINKSKASK